MSIFISFFRLIRLPNLIFIALTMFLVRFALIEPVFHAIGMNSTLNNLEFTLLVTATLLVAAAGYMINDYFDVKIDSVNKPMGLLVGNVFHRRTVMVMHLAFNLIGIFIGFYLANRLGNYRIGAIFFLSAGLLWFYSTSFKKQFLVGNLVVSALTALVLLTVMTYEIMLYDAISTITQMAAAEINKNIMLYMLFAFWISMIREIIKDMEDIKGDADFNSRTIPIVIGLRNTKYVVATLIILMMLLIAFLMVAFMGVVWFAYTALLIQLPLFFLAYLLFKAHDKEEYHRLSNLTKGVMLTGILSMGLFYIFTT
jgi:4-hydroxybenzoate polyprenyltransferase